MKLVSKEGKIHEVAHNVATMSTLVKNTIGEDEDEDDNEKVPEVPLPNVTDIVLKKVIDYCTHFVEVEQMTEIETPLKSSKLEDIVQNWYCEFVDIDQHLLFDLVTAANFMDIKPLLDLTCLAVSIRIKGKTAAQLREIFNITNEDLNPDEQAQIRDESEWATSDNDGEEKDDDQ